MKRSVTAESSAGSDRLEVATIEKIETTTTKTIVEVFQVPELPTPRCWSDQFRWTGLPLEREDDMVSTAPDAFSVSSSIEELKTTTDDEVVAITVRDSDDMDIESDLDERRSVELMRTNLQVAPRRDLEVATIGTSYTVQESIWIEGSNDEPPQKVTWQIGDVELDTVDNYRNLFIMWNHYNLIGHDRRLGPVLLSFTTEVEADSNEKLFRVLLWLPMGTLHKLIPTTSVGLNPSPLKLAKVLYNHLDVVQFKPVLSLEASNLIADFEKDIHTSNHLFVIRSRSTPALKEFLEFFGQLVQLRDRTLVFTVFKDKDIEFRVTSCDDPSQQLVAILFQDNSEHPVTNPMHALIVVQPLAANPPNCRYRVTVGDDASKVFAKAPELREFILTRLINADNALKSEKIRAPLLDKLVKQLEQQTREFLGEDRESGEKSTVAPAWPPQLEVNTWKYAQLQRYLDDHRKLMVQIGKLEHADEALQERIAQKFSALEQFGSELLRINSQVSLEIQSQIEPVQEQVSRCKRDLLDQIAGSPVPTPVAPSVENISTVQVVERVKKKEEESDGSSSNEAFIYQRLVAEIEDEGEWINQKERWLKAFVAEDYFACCFEVKYDEFMKEYVSHWDNFQTMCAEGGKLTNGKFCETIDQLCTLLGTWFDKLKKLATQSLAHASTAKLGNSSVATTDSGFFSATDTSLVQAQSPLAILGSLAKSIRVDRKTLWTTCVGMRRAWQYDRFLVISEVTLAQIIEIVGFFLDYVASLLREDSPEDDLEKITKRLLLKRVSGQLFSFFREDRHRGERDLEKLIKKRALKERFLRTFSRKTKIANEAANLLQLLTLDFVMNLRNNTRRLLDGSYVTQFEHIDKALREIGFGFLVRPEERID